MGTWAYMAPEVAAGEPATIASDLFSCGVVLYELATGRHPVLRGSDDIVEAAHIIKTDSSALQNLNLQDITNLLLKLPAGYRTVFNMYVIDGYTHKEIAKELGISDSTSKTQLMKAKNLLKQLIKDNDTIPAAKYAY